MTARQARSPHCPHVLHVQNRPQLANAYRDTAPQHAFPMESIVPGRNSPTTGHPMIIDLPNILKAIGPAASIVFAAWIFMGFLQQRYDSAVNRYLEMIEAFRTGEVSDPRRDNIKDQVLAYRHRCELMAQANLAGLISAMLLILTLIVGELAIIFPAIKVFAYVGAATALLGLALVIVAAALVVREGFITRRQLISELLDVPELAQSIGREPGAISDSSRGHHGSRQESISAA
jgi:hypothetical protein